MTHNGYILIADITGYTRYLSESELEHAQDALTALLGLLVEHTRPPLVISRLAGDAVISYGLGDNFIQGQTIVEKIEDTYVIFRKTIERLVLNNTCRCNACANISNLDLKFFFHYGTFGIQRISDDHDELVGSDVNLIHRLLKNSVQETTGVHAYALYTEAAIQQLGSEDLVEGMVPHMEAYEYLGEVKLWVQDMQPVWEEKRSGVSITFPTDNMWVRYEVDIDMPHEQVWDYLIQPEFRNYLIGTDKMEVANRTNGRIAANSVYQCYHGDKMVPQTILEWQPFESMIVKELFPMNHAVSWLAEYRLTAIDGGTRLTGMYSKPEGPFVGRTLHRLLSPMFKRFGRQFFEKFTRCIEDDYQTHDKIVERAAGVTGEQIRDAAAMSLRYTSSTDRT